jgi:hypothetical protein
MTFNIDKESAMRLEQAQRNDSGPGLEPGIPIFWHINGNAQNKQAHPVLYTGGWATEADKYDEILGDYDLVHHSGLEEFVFVNRKGKEIRSYGAQHLFVSVIAGRRGWQDKETKAIYPLYKAGTRHKQQTLALLAERVGKEKYAVWGPVMLTTSGYQVGFFRDAIRDWNKYTKPAREALAAELGWAKPPVASLFWMPLGQFSKTPKVKMVGKGEQSPITPIRTYVGAEPLALNVLKNLYIGADAQALSVEVLDAHEEYLGAWRDGYVPPTEDIDNVVEEDISPV